MVTLTVGGVCSIEGDSLGLFVSGLPRSFKLYLGDIVLNSVVIEDPPYKKNCIRQVVNRVRNIANHSSQELCESAV
eukprot:scaffold1934_cov79-Cylindrotheca_fusiformis.AAC.3